LDDQLPFADTPRPTNPVGPEPTSSTVPTAEADLLRRKLARLSDFLETTLNESDSRMAAMGIAEEAVLRLLVRLDQEIDRVLAGSLTDPARFGDVQLLIREFCLTATLAQRFANLRLAFADLLAALPQSR
jgi:hypothetical protein